MRRRIKYSHYCTNLAIRNAAAAFRALVCDSRLHLLASLSHREHCVSDLHHYVGMQQPQISAHLRVLREAQLVTVRREGQRVYYRINPILLDEITLFLQSLKERPRPTECSLDCCQRL